MDIRNNIFNFKKNVTWKGSLILYIATFITWTLQFISPMAYWGYFRSKRNVNGPFPKMVTELWLLIIFLTQIILLINWNSFSSIEHCICRWIAIWLMADSVAATLRDIIIAPHKHGYVQTYNTQRWLLNTLITIVEVILNFSILILFYGTLFNKAITNSLTAVYFSTVTFLTLGYGDIFPTASESKTLVLSELGFFLFFIALKLPIAVAMIKSDEYKGDTP